MYIWCNMYGVNVGAAELSNGVKEPRSVAQLSLTTFTCIQTASFIPLQNMDARTTIVQST